MERLLSYAVMSSQPFKEGQVHVFQQAVQGKGVKKAILHMTAFGVYEAEINGVKVGEQFFAPGFTYYHKELLYQTYDVTAFLQEGENELKVYLGQGWYCGRFTFDNKVQIYGEQSGIAWILEMETEDGDVHTLVSSPDSVTEITSPYGYAGFYDGEVYYGDGCLTQDGISLPHLNQSRPVVAFQGKFPEGLNESIIGVKLQEEMPVVQVHVHNDVTILDFGQNFAGIVEIDPSFMVGDKLCLRHGELLTPTGDLYTTNLRKAKQEIVYYKGHETKKYRPRFTYMGFRYVELTGVPYQEGLITAYALYSDMERTGTFTTENPLVQQLYNNQIWGQKSNFVEVPTDCPQRDERMGYTGDAHVFAQTASYNFDTRFFYKKFLSDMRYSQMDNSEGYIGSTAPANGPSGIGFLTMVGWGNAVTLMPEMLYWQYGNISFIKDQYESMKLFVEAEIRKMGDAHLWLAPNLGDWLMLGKDVAWMAMHNHPVSNAFIVNDLRFLSETAAILGYLEDAESFHVHYLNTKQAYMDAFIDEEGRMKDDYQGAYILALKHVLTSEDNIRPKVVGHLIDHIRANGMQTGFFSTEHLLPLLADEGESQLAYDLLLQEGCPGWMYQVKCGATTTWERWDALMPDGSVNEMKMSEDNMVSFNHYAFGSVGKFYYQYILGIKPVLPGFESIRIQPFVDSRLGEVAGSYQSVYGKIQVTWKIHEEEKKVVLNITTPVLTEIILPDSQHITVESGTYHFECKQPNV